MTRPQKLGPHNPNWRGGKASHPLYDIYMDMIGRCHRLTHQRYADYGGRGIAVCDRWRGDFWAFVADMGERPEGLTLDRENNDLGYGPGNCRWATYAEQRHNRRPERPRTRCPNDHEYTPENTRISAKGYQECLTCVTATRSRQAARNAERRSRTRGITRTSRTKAKEILRAAQIAEMCQRFAELGSDYAALVSLSAELGVGKEAVRRRLAAGGVTAPDGRATVSRNSPVVKKSRFTSDDIAAMRNLYEGGASQQKIAAQFGTLQSHVGNMLRRAGVQMRPSGIKKLSDSQETEVLTLCRSGTPQNEAARRYGISQSLVSHLLKRAGTAA